MEAVDKMEATMKLTRTTTARFDYVQYDQAAKDLQEHFKLICTSLDIVINKNIESPRSKALALTKLEEAYMWIGKGIRDDQIARGSDATNVPERSAG